MKITKTKLRQIIKEEIEQLARARSNISLSRGQAQNIRQTQNRAKKIIKFLFSPDPDNVEQGLAILDALEDQQLIDTISNHFVFRSDGRIAIRRFKIPDETLEMILNYFAEKSDRFKDMLAQIEKLVINYNNFITNVDFLRFCTNLTNLDLSWCKSLENVDGLEDCTNLTTLRLNDCSLLQNVDGLKGCTNLTTLDLDGCRSLQNVDGLQGLTNLTRLDLSLCYSLQNVDALKECANLKGLSLYGCRSLQNVDGLQELTNLTTLSLSWCRSLQNVDGLEGCTNLTTLNLRGCSSLQNVDGLEGCTNLTTLVLRECQSLPIKLQQLFKTDSSGTAYEKFMAALKASKRNSL
jgi:Leucine-rich repeat (LRR) protein